MGRRKKKPFINKKEAQTYRLVPRSHDDPLAGDLEEAQHVLKPEQPEERDERDRARGDRAAEQKKFGIFFEDDYDYMQHLKAPGTAVLGLDNHTPASAEGGSRSTGRHASLPEELFGQEVAIEGHLDKILPVSGPRPDWDPDIVEALENAEISSDTGEQLEDDFVMLANSGQPGSRVYVTEQQQNDPSEEAWWSSRGDFAVISSSEKLLGVESDEEGEEEEEASSLGSLDCVHGNREGKRGAQFTDYSMTSSVVPRSEALTLLDDRFEEFMAGYTDDQLGAGEEGEGVGVEGSECKQSEWDMMVLQAALEDFEKNFRDNPTLKVDDVCEVKERKGEGMELEEERGVELEEEGCDSEEDESSESATEEDEEETDVILVPEEVSKKDRWDCESILSTYSTLYNHPTRIVEPRTKPQSTSASSNHQIKLSRKTGMPLGVVPGPLPKENHPSRGTVTRARNENKEDKKARKLAVKEERKQRRQDKKATKLAFKAEAQKQGKVLLNASTRMATVV